MQFIYTIKKLKNNFLSFVCEISGYRVDMLNAWKL